MSIAIIVGGAVGGWEQRAEAIELVAAADLETCSVAINDAGIEHPDPLDEWVSLHPEKFEGWERKRVEIGLGGGYRKWTQEARRHHATNTARKWRDGSSGLTAVDAALNGVGCAAAILCGVPMDDSVNRYHGVGWGKYRRYRRGFQKALPEFSGCVRSMAGWTREVLGAPDLEWLAVVSAPEPHEIGGGR